MAINSVFDAVRTLQIFFERMGHPPWSAVDVGGRWQLKDAGGRTMGVDFGPAKQPLPDDAVDFIRALNYAPALRRVKVEHKLEVPSELCVVVDRNASDDQVAAMLTAMMNATGVLGDSSVAEVSGELAPSVLQYDNHGIIPMCVSGTLDYVPTIKLRERKKYEH